ncbi:hypothetical protein [Ancylobacter pratisalsi]|uniref:Uncharacterized protein n=1 Tax=Ancylobacter pratisalsi TaxID=1745854 RepID=A0A6P1YUJ1_9HYPH|nr:hypothetical protein [Ancylobacter pratisalsi]QIB36550.1 hypothetical protein G3A50_22305 [Ancylobacter pratisalsi]
MAKGRPPKNPHLRLIQGTHRPSRHGAEWSTKQAENGTKSGFGPLKRPPGLRGRVLAAWNQYIAPATWLDGSREPAAIAFCELWGEFKSKPSAFASARHTQLRGLMRDLGLNDPRNRPPRPAAPRDEFFDD